MCTLSLRDVAPRERSKVMRNARPELRSRRRWPRSARGVTEKLQPGARRRGEARSSFQKHHRPNVEEASTGITHERIIEFRTRPQRSRIRWDRD